MSIWNNSIGIIRWNTKTHPHLLKLLWLLERDFSVPGEKGRHIVEFDWFDCSILLELT